MHGESRGAYNLTGPAPATNADFARALGHVLRRPALLPLPSFALTALFGEMAQSTILDGQRVLPVRLEREGFTFQHASLESALRFELGR
jgi:NAD dependent epimerase/dehydratase family enzyme